MHPLQRNRRSQSVFGGHPTFTLPGDRGRALPVIAVAILVVIVALWNTLMGASLS